MHQASLIKAHSCKTGTLHDLRLWLFCQSKYNFLHVPVSGRSRLILCGFSRKNASGYSNTPHALWFF